MPQKPYHINIAIRSHTYPDLDYRVKAQYYATLADVLKELARQFTRPSQLKRVPTVLYNRYGQEVPLSYHTSRDGLAFYIDKCVGDPKRLINTAPNRATLSIANSTAQRSAAPSSATTKATASTPRHAASQSYKRTAHSQEEDDVPKTCMLSDTD